MCLSLSIFQYFKSHIHFSRFRDVGYQVKWRLFNLKRKRQLKRRNIEVLELVVK